MITITPRAGSFESGLMKSLICFITSEQDSIVGQVGQAYNVDVVSFMQAGDFKARAQATFVLPVQVGNAIKTLIFVGLGAKKIGSAIDIELYRRAVGKAIKLLQGRKIDSGTIVMPDSQLFGVSSQYLAQETAVAASMAEYHFDEFISSNDRKAHKNFNLELVSSQESERDLASDVARGLLIANGVNQARRWVDMPPSRFTPMHLVEEAQKIAQQHKLSCTTFLEKEVIQMGMGGLAGVSAGSDQDCALVILEYKTEQKDAPTIALVGKGITFDSGGLSIKPADSMESMKDDMAGAAAVINAMNVLAQLKPSVNVIAVAPLSENLPSGKATKPGDILKFYNGKTAEVRNTDAEGRLILADALSYTVAHYKPDAIIDIATLTGACAYALGPFFSGLMSQHAELAKKVEDAGKRTGDRVWPLPFTDDYKVAIKSSVADICNIGSRKYRAGAITAGFFLQEFVGDTPWVHLDVAGTAFEVPDISYYSSGATGVGVRLFVDLIMRWHE